MDGQPPGTFVGYGPSGTANLQVPSDGKAPAVSVTAMNEAGAGQTASEQVKPSSG